MDFDPETRNAILKHVEDMMEKMQALQTSVSCLSSTLDTMVVASDRVSNICSGKLFSESPVDFETNTIEIVPDCEPIYGICYVEESREKTMSIRDSCMGLTIREKHQLLSMDYEVEETEVFHSSEVLVEDVMVGEMSSKCTIPMISRATNQVGEECEKLVADKFFFYWEPGPFDFCYNIGKCDEAKFSATPLPNDQLMLGDIVKGSNLNAHRADTVKGSSLNVYREVEVQLSNSGSIFIYQKQDVQNFTVQFLGYIVGQKSPTLNDASKGYMIFQYEWRPGILLPNDAYIPLQGKMNRAVTIPNLGDSVGIFQHLSRYKCSVSTPMDCNEYNVVSVLQLHMNTASSSLLYHTLAGTGHVVVFLKSLLAPVMLGFYCWVGAATFDPGIDFSSVCQNILMYYNFGTHLWMLEIIYVLRTSRQPFVIHFNPHTLLDACVLACMCESYQFPSTDEGSYVALEACSIAQLEASQLETISIGGCSIRDCSSYFLLYYGSKFRLILLVLRQFHLVCLFLLENNVLGLRGTDCLLISRNSTYSNNPSRLFIVCARAKAFPDCYMQFFLWLVTDMRKDPKQSDESENSTLLQNLLKTWYSFLFDPRIFFLPCTNKPSLVYLVKYIINLLVREEYALFIIRYGCKMVIQKESVIVIAKPKSPLLNSVPQGVLTISVGPIFIADSILVSDTCFLLDVLLQWHIAWVQNISLSAALGRSATTVHMRNQLSWKHTPFGQHYGDGLLLPSAPLQNTNATEAMTTVCDCESFGPLRMVFVLLTSITVLAASTMDHSEIEGFAMVRLPISMILALGTSSWLSWQPSLYHNWESAEVFIGPVSARCRIMQVSGQLGLLLVVIAVILCYYCLTGLQVGVQATSYHCQSSHNCYCAIRVFYVTSTTQHRSLFRTAATLVRYIQQQSKELHQQVFRVANSECYMPMLQNYMLVVCQEPLRVLGHLTCLWMSIVLEFTMCFEYSITTGTRIQGLRWTALSQGKYFNILWSRVLWVILTGLNVKYQSSMLDPSRWVSCCELLRDIDGNLVEFMLRIAWIELITNYNGFWLALHDFDGYFFL